MPENPITKNILTEENNSIYYKAHTPQTYAHRLHQILMETNQTLPEVFRKSPPTIPSYIANIEIVNDNFFSSTESKQFSLITMRKNTTSKNTYSILINKEKFSMPTHESYTSTESQFYITLKILEIIETSQFQKFIIDTDSQAFINGIKNPYSKITLIQSIQNKLSNIRDKTVKFIHKSITAEYLNSIPTNSMYSLIPPSVLTEKYFPIPLNIAQRTMTNAIHSQWDET